MMTPLQRLSGLARLYEARIESLARASGQSHPRYQVLRFAREGRTIPEIARRLGKARQSVQRIADALAESGLARFEVNPAHRRSPILHVTDSGRAVANRIEAEIERWEQTVAANLEDEETETLLLALESLRDGLER